MKLVLSLVASFALVTPALACPNMDHDQNEAPKTADKDKKAPDKKEQKADPAKDKQQQPADTAKSKDGKGEKKPGDKVSMK